jgi:hypothetical protein
MAWQRNKKTFDTIDLPERSHTGPRRKRQHLALSCLTLSSLVLHYRELFCFVLSCLALSCLVVLSLSCRCRVVSCLVLSCLVLSCLVLSCLVLSCLGLGWLGLSCVWQISPRNIRMTINILLRNAYTQYLFPVIFQEVSWANTSIGGNNEVKIDSGIATFMVYIDSTRTKKQGKTRLDTIRHDTTR